METAWSNSAARPLSADDGYNWSFGHAAYAQRQAAMYRQLHNRCNAVVNNCNLEELPVGGILSDVISKQWSEAAEKDKAFIAEMLETIDTFQATGLSA